MQEMILYYKKIQYIIRYPEGYLPGKRYPVILFLHGAGSRGTDIGILRNNPFFRITGQYPDFPFITIAPQCPVNSWFDLFETLQELVRNLAAESFTDVKRLYLMGNSMGGYATWQLAMSMPGYFAAVCPICGGGMYWNAARLRDVPVWAFHGGKDTTVLPEESVKMTDAVNRSGGYAKLTIYPENGHDAWSDTYRNPEVFEWLLSCTNRRMLKTIDWQKAVTISVTDKASYPRLYRLRDGTLLCGIDGFCFRSSDNGTTWSGGSDYRRNHRVTDPDGKEYPLICANSAFFELDDGTVLVGYRATGYLTEDKSLFCTKLLVSQSRDGGTTWTAHSVMCEYYDEEGQFKGVWEPHFGLIDGVLTCFYANDSRTVIEPPYQNIESLQWINGKWTCRTVIADGTANKSRDGMPVWQQLADGSFVCVIEGWSPGTSELCIELIHSPDGISWSKPQIIHRSTGGNDGAPYVTELPTGQLLVTYQDPKRHCCSILSDGTPVPELTAEHFSEPVNVFGTDEHHFSMWNAQYLTGYYLYAVTGTNGSPGGSGTVLKRIALKDLLPFE